MRPTNTPRWILLLELIGLFVLLPILYWADLIPFHKILPLTGLFCYCFFFVVRELRFAETIHGSRKVCKTIFFQFILAVILIICILAYYDSPLFVDVIADKKLLTMIILYPVLSALPQEIIFRKFFFARYSTLIPGKWPIIIVNVILFAFAHIYFANWVVLVFTLVGGFLFASTYLQTKSLLAVTIEHTLYGCFVLVSGLSPYFYKAF